MMRLVDWLRRLFVRPRPQSPEPGCSPSVREPIRFPEVDVAALARQLDLENKGRQSGERNEPPADSDVFDSVEQGIVEEIKRERDRAVEKCNSQVRLLRSQFSLVDPQTLIAESLSAAGNARVEVAAKAAQGKADLLRLKRRSQELEQALEEFREKNGRETPASYPESWWPRLIPRSA